MGPLFVGFLAILLGGVVIALKDQTAELFRRSSRFTFAPEGIYTPAVVRFTGVILVIFGAGMLVLAVFFLFR